jgi:hypothetical protein
MLSGKSDFVPSAEEIACFKERPPVLATIHMVDGASVAEELPLTPDFDTERVCFLCAQFLGLTDSHLELFGLFVHRY